MDSPKLATQRPTKAPRAFVGPDGTRSGAIADYARRIATLEAEISEAHAMSRERQLVPARKLMEALIRERLLTWQLLNLASTMDANDRILSDSFSERQRGPRVRIKPEEALKFAIAKGYYANPKRITKTKLLDLAAKEFPGVGARTFERRLLEARREKPNQ